MSLVNFIGSRIITAEAARISAPPGTIIRGGYRNIVLATPMRSGTHIAMDLIMNNLPRYRRRPLYINLDTLLLRDLARDTLYDAAGYVVKTHFPSGRVRNFRPQIERLARQSLVVIVHRPTAEIRASLQRWVDAGPDLPRIRKQLANLESELAEFHTFWQAFSPYNVTFRDLFDAERCQVIVSDIARLTDHPDTYCKTPLVPVSKPMLVYLNKALTRTLGRHAPRIDTTIRSLR